VAGSPFGEYQRPVQQDHEDDQRGVRRLGLREPAECAASAGESKAET
jgi:hypothetical protein